MPRVKSCRIAIHAADLGTIKMTMRFNDVKDVQVFLHRLGFDPGTVDGKIGKNTLGALSRWVDSIDPTIPEQEPSGVPMVPIRTKSWSEDVEWELNTLWRSARITDTGRFKTDAARILKNKDRYQEVATAVNPAMPWWFVGIIHSLEAGGSFQKHLHNGDSLRARTVNVPKGRPVGSNPPFTWFASAYDALTMRGKAYHKQSDWSIARILWRLEGYNGYGYRLYRGIHSPYLWAGTNHYTAGKYVRDGVWDSNAVSTQSGAAGLMLALGVGETDGELV